jgi:RNA polymerase sigma-70 factor (ECF subfamily)
VGDQHESAAEGRAEDAEIREMRRVLLAAVEAICPAWLRAQAEDVTQRAIIKVLAARSASRSQPLPRSYLRRVAHTALVDEIRSRRARAHDRPDDAAVAARADTAASLERTLELRRLGQQIVDCLGCVADDRRRAVTLHLQGFARAEVCALLGVSQKRADNLTYRGLDDLRRCLRAKGHGL